MRHKYKNITQILNNVTTKTIRWCTPSIDLAMKKVNNPYLSDMSISFEKLGLPSEPSGIFQIAYKKAANAYGSEKTLFTVNGSTGGNFIAIKSLSKQIPNLRILAQRNIHKSILHACQDYNVSLLFIEPHIDPQLQIFYPNSINEIIKAIKKTKPHVLLLTNPTYEGLTLNLKKLVLAVRKINPNLIIYLDEAWGAHLQFSDKLPDSGMQAGVDICIQSTHKQGGALQQTGLIHWNTKRINSKLLISSFRSLTSTSPSYLLLASIDAAREHLEINGSRMINNSLMISKKLKNKLNDIKGIKTINLTDLKRRSAGVYSKDDLKIILDVSKTGFTGFTIARLLEVKFNIVVEKCNATSLILIVPFQSKLSDVSKTVYALKYITEKYESEKNHLPIPALETPQNSPRVLDSSDVAKLYQEQIESIPLANAKGRISAENITPYPPGIPTTIQGEEFTAKAISFYQSLKNYPNSHILAYDITMETVLVVK